MRYWVVLNTTKYLAHLPLCLELCVPSRFELARFDHHIIPKCGTTASHHFLSAKANC